MSNEVESSGIGLLSVLGIVFVVLKLTGTVAWSWLWVLMPFWVVPAVGIVGIGVFLLVYGIVATVQAIVN